MLGANIEEIHNKGNDQRTILLALLPFWDPQIPPLGLSSLKSFLQQHRFKVRVIDFNLQDDFRNFLYVYSETLKGYIPKKKRGNFYKIVHDVLESHMIAHLNHKDKSQYLDSVKSVVYTTFYSQLKDDQVFKLIKIAADFFTKLESYLLNLLKKEKPAVLGLSVYSGTLPASLFAFKLTKTEFPHIKTIMGGGIFTDQLNVDSPNFKSFLEQTPYIDKIFVGEGEILLLKYLNNDLPQSKRVYTLEDTNQELFDISTAVPPDFSDLDVQFYPYLSAYTSRGCPFNCRFCTETLMWGTYRKKNPQQIVEELLKLHREYNCQLFMFGDSLINPVITGLAKELLKIDESIYWDGYLRPDKHVGNIKNTLLWRRAGFYRARLGIESGSDRVLQLMGKKVSVDQIKQVLYSLAFAGIKTTTYWVVGYPGETEDDFEETLKLIEELRDEIYEADCTPFKYFLSGQPESVNWGKEYKNIPLFPEELREVLLMQTWTLNAKPSREESYKRMNRFVEHCNELGIPNPYSLKDSYKADERWITIHKNAVPSLVGFSKVNYISENKGEKNIYLAKNESLNTLEFEF